MMFLLLPALLLSAPVEPGHAVTRFSVVAGHRLALRDVDGDGRVDLLEVRDDGVAARLMTEDGAYPASPDALLAWPGEHLAWDLVDLAGDGRTSLLTLSPEGEVRAWGLDERAGEAEGRLLVESRSYLPHGRSRMRFARDVDGDGRVDLVLPAAGLFRIHLQGEDGAFERVLEVEYEADIEFQVGRLDRLDERFGQSLRIPWFSMEDVDGDGRIDLVSRTEQRVDFHLARGGLASTPSWTLDLAAMEGGPRTRELDLDDLFSNLDLGVRWRIADLDGEAPLDLVVVREDTLKVYLGGAASGVSSSPDQVLKLSGNLMLVFLRDVTGDGRVDLQLLRAERIGVGSLVQWLVLPGSLDFDLFTYANEGGSFSRRPTRRNTIALAIPRLLSFMDEAEELGERVEGSFEVPAIRLDWDGDGLRDDVADLVTEAVAEGAEVRERGELTVRLDAAAELEGHVALFEGRTDELSLDRLLEALLLEDVDRMEDGATRTIDLGSLAEWAVSPGAVLRAGAAERAPAYRLEAPLSGGTLAARDLNGDGREDLVAFTEDEVLFLVSQPGEAR